MIHKFFQYYLFQTFSNHWQTTVGTEQMQDRAAVLPVQVTPDAGIQRLLHITILNTQHYTLHQYTLHHYTLHHYTLHHFTITLFQTHRNKIQFQTIIFLVPQLWVKSGWAEQWSCRAERPDWPGPSRGWHRRQAGHGGGLAEPWARGWRRVCTTSTTLPGRPGRPAWLCLSASGRPLSTTKNF